MARYFSERKYSSYNCVVDEGFKCAVVVHALASCYRKDNSNYLYIYLPRTLL